jgi:uncharacterized protein (TIGR01244 family)
MADIRPLSPTFSAAAQILPSDLPDLVARGIRHLVSNRPDTEVPDTLSAEAMARAAGAAGLAFTHIPIDHSGFSDDQVEAMAVVLQSADGPVLGYCRSGTRSTFLWALAEAQRGRPAETLVEAARGAGYDLSPIRPLLDRLAGPAA